MRTIWDIILKLNNWTLLKLDHKHMESFEMWALEKDR
jgi:hypothetical protein